MRLNQRYSPDISQYAETKKSDLILQQQHQKLQQQTPSQEEDDEKKIKELQQFIHV